MSGEIPLEADELIGKEIEIVDSTHPEQIGVQGAITDETQNMLEIQTETRSVKVPKKHSIFKIEGQLVQGDEIAFKPHERIKKTWQKLQKWR